MVSDSVLEEEQEEKKEEEEKNREDEKRRRRSLPALVIISSSDTESCSGCIPLVVWLKETSWLSLAPPLPAPPPPPTPPPIRDGFRRGSMSSSNCSRDTWRGAAEHRQETRVFRQNPHCHYTCSPCQKLPAPAVPIGRWENCTWDTWAHLHWAVVKHLQGHLLLVLFLILQRCQTQGCCHPSSLLSLQLLLKAGGVVVLQEDGGATGVPLDLHPQDTIAGPTLPHRLQTVDGRAREGDVDVGEDEEDEESLRKDRYSLTWPTHQFLTWPEDWVTVIGWCLSLWWCGCTKTGGASAVNLMEQHEVGLQADI